VIHIDLADPDEDHETDAEGGYCCMGAAAMGRCTCWRETYDRPQLPAVVPIVPPTVRRGGCCGSCGVVDGLADRLGIDDAAVLGRAFFCHQGLRRAVERHHPDGRVRPADPHAYAEATVDVGGVSMPLKADGTVADLCAAWAKWAREAGHTWFDRGLFPPGRRP